MDKKDEKDLFSLVEGVTQVDAAAFEVFEKEMTEEVIPQLIQVVDKRRENAAQSRLWQLKC